MDKVRDYGEITLALLGLVAGGIWFVLKKIIEYVQLKSDIRGIQEKLDMLLSKQSSIIIDIELIKYDMSLPGKQKGSKQCSDEKED